MHTRPSSRYSTIAAAICCAAFFTSCANGASDSAKGADRSNNSNSGRIEANRSYSGSGSSNNNSTNNNLNPGGDISQLATDPDYKISAGDDIFISVFGEGNLSVGQRIDTQGILRWPLIGEVKVTGRTVRENEHYLEQVLIDKRMLKRPTVNIIVRSYASKEVTVLGAVNGGGKFRLPQEKESIEIVDLISLMGGFRPTAKSDKVKITHIDEQGHEKKDVVDVEAMMKGSRKALKSYVIYPGDKIYVDERLY